MLLQGPHKLQLPMPRLEGPKLGSLSRKRLVRQAKIGEEVDISSLNVFQMFHIVFIGAELRTSRDERAFVPKISCTILD
jgi:hypothetical protein